ncbi:SpdA protein, partial [Streptomyces purpurogeneiscleroticus]|nr:SpdA protein [Streptomyces purpurogeneiscleroticus]
PAPTVPPALIAHARKVADNHQAATGTPIDADTLRARLGVPPVLAEAITAQLA